MIDLDTYRTIIQERHREIQYTLAVPFGGVSLWGFIGSKLCFVVDGDYAFARRLIRSWIDSLRQEDSRDYYFILN